MKRGPKPDKLKISTYESIDDFIKDVRETFEYISDTSHLKDLPKEDRITIKKIIKNKQ